MKVPPDEIEDLVQEAWLSVVEHAEQFRGMKIKRRVHCWLRLVAHGKAVDLFRYLRCCPCEPLATRESETIDETETERAETAELREWLIVLLAKVRRGNEGSFRLLCAHFFHERSIQELAYESGTTAKAIDCRIRRLLGKLRVLAEHVPFHDDARRERRGENLRKK